MELITISLDNIFLPGEDITNFKKIAVYIHDNYEVKYSSVKLIDFELGIVKVYLTWNT